MRIIEHTAGIDCTFKSNVLNALVIENAKIYEEAVQKIYGKINTADDALLLYDENDELLKNAKTCDIIFSPFDLNPQSSKFQKKLISYLSDIVESNEVGQKLRDNYASRNEIAGEITELSEYPITFDCEYSTADILKEMNIKLAELSGNFCEKLTDYASACAEFLNIRTFFMVGCKAYVAPEEYQYLRKWVGYQNFEFIFLENNDMYLPEYVNKYILDEDMCIVH